MNKFLRFLIMLPFTVTAYWVWVLIFGLFASLIMWDSSMILRNVTFWTEPKTGLDVLFRIVSWAMAGFGIVLTQLIDSDKDISINEENEFLEKL